MQVDNLTETMLECFTLRLYEIPLRIAVRPLLTTWWIKILTFTVLQNLQLPCLSLHTGYIGRRIFICGIQMGFKWDSIKMCTAFGIHLEFNVIQQFNDHHIAYPNQCEYFALSIL